MLQLILHMTGDYLVQNDWMATNKKKLSWTGELACQVHCITYTIPFLVIYGWRVALAVYLSHYAIDRSGFIAWFMKIAGKEDFAKPPFAPWSIFAVDNTFHLICNYLAIAYL